MDTPGRSASVRLSAMEPPELTFHAASASWGKEKSVEPGAIGRGVASPGGGQYEASAAAVGERVPVSRRQVNFDAMEEEEEVDGREGGRGGRGRGGVFGLLGRIVGMFSKVASSGVEENYLYEPLTAGGDKLTLHDLVPPSVNRHAALTRPGRHAGRVGHRGRARGFSHWRGRRPGPSSPAGHGHGEAQGRRGAGGEGHRGPAGQGDAQREVLVPSLFCAGIACMACSHVGSRGSHSVCACELGTAFATLLVLARLLSCLPHMPFRPLLRSAGRSAPRSTTVAPSSLPGPAPTRRSRCAADQTTRRLLVEAKRRA